MKESKKLKNKNILNKLIYDTISNEIEWLYIGSGEEYNNINYVFINVENIIGDKFLVFELNLNTNIDLSKIRIYMQNSNRDDTIPIKNIYYSSKIKTLGKNLLKNLDQNDDNVDDEILSDIQKNLIPVFY